VDQPIFDVVINEKGVPMFEFRSPFLLDDMLQYKKEFKKIEATAKPGQRYVFYSSHFELAR
jgi:hypothetical protein